MRSHRLRFWVAVLCFVLLIAYFVIPVYRAEAAGGTVSPLDENTVLGTFGQSFSGTYGVGNNEFNSCTFDYVRTIDFDDVTTSSDTINYYKNLGCKIFLYRAAVSGLGSVSRNSYNASVDLGVSISGVTSMHFLCGFVEGKQPAGFIRDVKNGLNLTSNNNQQFVESTYAYGWAHMSFYYTGVHQSTDLSYGYITNYTYSGESSSVSLGTLYGCCNTSSNAMLDSNYIYFYIVSPVCNDDIVVSGGGGSSASTADIYEYLSNTLNDIMESNGGLLQSIYNFIVTIPDAILEGLHDLFIPSQEDLEDFKDDIDDLLHNTFGGLYDAEDSIHDSLSNISSGSVSTIHFPGISVAGFTLPAQEVPIKPAGMEVLFDTLAVAIDIICTFAFLNMMKDKLHKLFSKDDGGD